MLFTLYEIIKTADVANDDQCDHSILPVVNTVTRTEASAGVPCL